MTFGYPAAFSDLGPWAAANGVSGAESRVRFAQYGVLCAIAQSRILRQGVVFKGGNALDFIWQPNRSTSDLDFSFDANAGEFDADLDAFKALLTGGLARSSGKLGIMFAVNGLKRQPPGAGRTFASIEARVGYALPDEHRLRLRMTNGQTSSRVIRVEISGNEPICALTLVSIDDVNQIRVCTLEDIVAEKLRALLQQPIRNRERRQDLLDIAVALLDGHALDSERISAFLITKAAVRNVPVSKAAFHDPEIARRARSGYAELAATTRTRFVPFEEAWPLLVTFIDDLLIPAGPPE